MRGSHSAANNSNDNSRFSKTTSEKQRNLSQLLKSKRCDYNCSNCQNQKHELYPGAKPPPQINLITPPSSFPNTAGFPSAFGDQHVNSAPSIMANSGGLGGGQFWGDGFGNQGGAGMSGGFGNSYYPQSVGNEGFSTGSYTSPGPLLNYDWIWSLIKFGITISNLHVFEHKSFSQ